MTPKEKAEELVQKYKPFVYCYMGSGMLSNTYDEDVVLTMSKKCALIAVDEIQDFITKYDNHFQDFKYWDEVTQEIQNL